MPNFENGLHMQKAARQTYSIYIPYRHTIGESVPLIVMLHWGGKKTRFGGREFLELVGLPAFNSMQAIIVAPDRKRKHWALPQAADDLEKLIDYLDQIYNLDPKRRMVAGFSEGGIGVWYLGLERPRLFSCGISVGSPIPEQIVDYGWGFPLYTIHGVFDEIVPHDLNQKRAKDLKSKGAPIEFATVENATHGEIRKYIDPLINASLWVQNIWED